MDDFEVIEPKEEVVDPKQQLKERRGKTLPVICILTMVNVGWMAINTIIRFASGPSSPEEIEEVQEAAMASVQEDSPKWVVDMVEDTMEYTIFLNDHIYEMGAIQLAIAGLGFLAAWMMYKLKRVGFFIYLAFCAAAIILPLAAVPGNQIGMVDALFFTAFPSAIFIVLYAVQLKRMS